MLEIPVLAKLLVQDVEDLLMLQPDVDHLAGLLQLSRGVVVQNLGYCPAVLELDHGSAVGQLACLLLLFLAAAAILVQKVAEVKHRDLRGQRPVQQSFTE